MQSITDAEVRTKLTSEIRPRRSARIRAAKKKLVTRDPDIRIALMRELRKRFSDPSRDLILQEFGCKGARIDVAVVNGFMYGFEIKSDSDSLDRLDRQVGQYSRIFDFITLICGQKLISAAREVVPKWWGLQRAQFKNGGVVIQELRAARPNPNQNPFAVAKMLWKTEALAVLRRFGHRGITSRCTADEVWNAVAAHVPIAQLTNEVRQAIKARGGSGFAKPLIPNDDSCTTGSTVQANHSPDLSWLLSLQSPHLRH